jgi:hypothetical protein
MLSKLAPWLFACVGAVGLFLAWPVIRVGISSGLRDAGLCNSNVIDVPSARRHRPNTDTSGADSDVIAEMQQWRRGTPDNGGLYRCEPDQSGGMRCRPAADGAARPSSPARRVDRW